MRYTYSEPSPGAYLTAGVKWLLISNFAIFIFQQLVGFKLVLYFGLVPRQIHEKVWLWQIFTYMFLHGGLFHILFNLFTLWMFGCDIERNWGTKAFLKYYFLTGAGAGLSTLFLSWNSHIPTIGASGAIFGILVAYALMFPDRLIFLYFLIPIKAKYLVIIFGILEFLASLSHTPDGIGHFAHLGGMVIGFVYLKLDWRWNYFLSRFKSLKYRYKMKIFDRKRAERQKLLEKVDEILDKINQVGIENLTKEEKKILEQASQILAKNQENKIKP